MIDKILTAESEPVRFRMPLLRLFALFFLIFGIGCSGSSAPSGTSSGSIPRPVPVSTVANQTIIAAPTPPAPPATPKVSAAEASQEIALLGLTTTPVSDDRLNGLGEDLAGSVNLNALRQAVFAQINADRAANGLPAITYDAVAQNAGDLQNSREVTADHILAHRSLNGDLPYMRYSEVGGSNAEAENWASGLTYIGAATTISGSGSNVRAGACADLHLPPVTAANIQASLVATALLLECQMLNEVPPNDDHRKTILDNTMTSVGIGVGVSIENNGNSAGPAVRFFMTEEFTSQVLSNVQPPALTFSLSNSTPTNFSGTMPAGFTFNQLELFFETRSPLTATQASSILSYGLPSLFTPFFPILPPGTQYTPDMYQQHPDLQANVAISGSSFSVPLVFLKGTGVYTAVVWITNTKTGTSQEAGMRSIFVVN